MTARGRNQTPSQSHCVPGSGWRFERWKPANPPGEHGEVGDGHLRRHSKALESVLCGEGARCRNVFQGDMRDGRVDRTVAGREGQVLNPERGNRVKGEAHAQVGGLVKAAVLDAVVHHRDQESPILPQPRRAQSGVTLPCSAPSLSVRLQAIPDHFRLRCLSRVPRMVSTRIAVSRPNSKSPLAAAIPPSSRHSAGSRMSPNPSVVNDTSAK